MENSKISWTHHTFNPWVGCTKVSEGCTNCYAETLMDKRYGRVSWGKGNARKKTSSSNWKQPLKWNRQAEAAGLRFRIFCASLADVFDPEVEDRWRHDLLNLVIQTPYLDWMFLTKRAKEMRDFFKKYASPPANVWPGISAEHQAAADERIPFLLEIPATVHWISGEPLLGPIDFGAYLAQPEGYRELSRFYGPEGFDETGSQSPRDKPRLDWIIVGGESGGNARPMHPEWPRAIRDQCQTAGVAFHFKQWGEWAPREVHGERSLKRTRGDMVRVGKRKAGRELDGKLWDEFPVVSQGVT